VGKLYAIHPIANGATIHRSRFVLETYLRYAIFYLTEFLGFEVIRTPPAIQAKLKAAVDKGLMKWDELRF